LLLRRLCRSKKERILCGVCGGLAEYLKIDPVLIRLAAVAIFIVNPGVAIILYIAACILMPEVSGAPAEEEVEVKGEVPISLKEAGKIALVVVGAILIAAGVSFIMQPLIGWGLVDILRQLWDYLEVSGKLILGAVLAAVGVVLIIAAGKKSR